MIEAVSRMQGGGHAQWVAQDDDIGGRKANALKFVLPEGKHPGRAGVLEAEKP